MRYSPVEIQRHLSGYQVSGGSVQAYCSRNNLNYWTFREWRKRFPPKEAEAKTSFVRVELPSVGFIELVTASKATIRLPLDQDPDRIRPLLAAIKRSGLA